MGFVNEKNDTLATFLNGADKKTLREALSNFSVLTVDDAYLREFLDAELENSLSVKVRVDEKTYILSTDVRIFQAYDCVYVKTDAEESVYFFDEKGRLHRDGEQLAHVSLKGDDYVIAQRAVRGEYHSEQRPTLEKYKISAVNGETQFSLTNTEWYYHGKLHYLKGKASDGYYVNGFSVPPKVVDRFFEHPLDVDFLRKWATQPATVGFGGKVQYGARNLATYQYLSHCLESCIEPEGELLYRIAIGDGMYHDQVRELAERLTNFEPAWKIAQKIMQNKASFTTV